MKVNGMTLIRLRPQRIKPGCPTNAWVNARDRGYVRDWRKAIDREFSRSKPEPENWLGDSRRAN